MQAKALPRSKRILLYLSIIGPGLVVMLADTDAGSLISAAQMGAQFGYKLLLQAFILIPILYVVQELTVRLGLVTGMGHGELIKKEFGRFWAWISVGTLLITCVGAIITEMIGLNGIGALFGIPSSVVMTMTIGFLLVIALTGTYNFVERIAIAIGLFELVFLYIAWKAHPSLHEMLKGISTFPIHNKNYLYLTAANIGAVIMPWMIFYQQSAVVDKGLTVKSMKISRWDTSIGAIITQCIMAGILIACAATIGKSNPNTSLTSVQEISHSLTPFLGNHVGRLIFALGMLGACLVAMIVVTATAAWGLGEVIGYRHSLSDKPTQAPWFYTVYALTLIAGAVLVSSHIINVIKLNLAVEVMNALLLPIVLGFLYLLAIRALPEPYRLKGPYAWLCGIILFTSALVGVFAGLSGSI